MAKSKDVAHDIVVSGEKDVAHDIVVSGEVVRTYAPGCHPTLTAKECAESYAEKLGGKAVARGKAADEGDEE